MGFLSSWFQTAVTSRVDSVGQDTAAGEGTVGLEQLGGDVDPLALHGLTVVPQRQLVKVWQYN